MMRCLILPLLIISILGSCKIRKSAEVNGKNNFTVTLQPFDGMPPSQTKYVFTELKKFYPLIEIKSSVPLPPSAYYIARNRFRADTIINILSRGTEINHKTIGLTNKDISTTKNATADWGVMGLGFCPGKACIASTFRLSKSETNNQLFKVAIHELGHTFGLPHCDVESCFMRDAEGRNPTNEEREFCKHCRSFLVGKGWILDEKSM